MAQHTTIDIVSKQGSAIKLDNIFLVGGEDLLPNLNYVDSQGNFKLENHIVVKAMTQLDSGVSIDCTTLDDRLTNDYTFELITTLPATLVANNDFIIKHGAIEVTANDIASIIDVDYDIHDADKLYHILIRSDGSVLINGSRKWNVNLLGDSNAVDIFQFLECDSKFVFVRAYNGLIGWNDIKGNAVKCGTVDEKLHSICVLELHGDNDGLEEVESGDNFENIGFVVGDVVVIDTSQQYDYSKNGVVYKNQQLASPSNVIVTSLGSATVEQIDNQYLCGVRISYPGTRSLNSSFTVVSVAISTQVIAIVDIEFIGQTSKTFRLKVSTQTGSNSFTDTVINSGERLTITHKHTTNNAGALQVDGSVFDDTEGTGYILHGFSCGIFGQQKLSDPTHGKLISTTNSDYVFNILTQQAGSKILDFHTGDSLNTAFTNPNDGVVGGYMNVNEEVSSGLTRTVQGLQFLTSEGDGRRRVDLPDLNLPYIDRSMFFVYKKMFDVGGTQNAFLWRSSGTNQNIILKNNNLQLVSSGVLIVGYETDLYNILELKMTASNISATLYDILTNGNLYEGDRQSTANIFTSGLQLFGSVNFASSSLNGLAIAFGISNRQLTNEESKYIANNSMFNNRLSNIANDFDVLYKLDEDNITGTTVTDLSGNGNDGTLSWTPIATDFKQIKSLR